METKLPIAHEQSILVVGRKYSVAHAIVELNNGRLHQVPIIPFKHKDPQFGANFYHYHIDGRFGMDAWARGNYGVKSGITNYAVHCDWIEYKIKSIVYLAKRCVRLTTGTKPPVKDFAGRPSPYMLWYKTMIGKSCAGRKCPHFGTVMIEQNGQLFCPLHNLRGDIEKEIIV